MIPPPSHSGGPLKRSSRAGPAARGKCWAASSGPGSRPGSHRSVSMRTPGPNASWLETFSTAPSRGSAGGIAMPRSPSRTCSTRCTRAPWSWHAARRAMTTDISSSRPTAVAGHGVPLDGVAGPRLTASALLVAGTFQLTSFKCGTLTHCRSPLSFLLVIGRTAQGVPSGSGGATDSTAWGVVGR